jgi:hypothetical protein
MVRAVTFPFGDDFDSSQAGPFDPYDTPAVEDFYTELHEEHVRALEHLLEYLAATFLGWGIFGRLFRRNCNGEEEL